MGDLTHKESSDTTRIVGSDEVYAADVVLEDGIRKLATTKKVQVDSLSGQQLNATNYFFVDSVADGQTLRIEIDVTDFAPALDETFTVNVGETAKEFTDRIILELNQDFTNFQPYYKALDIDDNPSVYIISKAVGEAGENGAINSFRVTGTVALVNGVPAFDNFLRRGTLIQASQSTTDPRLGVFGISGTVESRDASVEGLFVQQPYDTVPANIDLNINGSGAPVVFTFPMDAIDDLFITEIKFFVVEIKTDNNVVMLPPIRTTDDFDDKFAFGGSNFDVYFASGDDKFSARFIASAFPLRRSGAFGAGNDDYIKITVQDNITSVNYLQCIVEGFRQEA
jgi:hypothetical protein